MCIVRVADASYSTCFPLLLFLSFCSSPSSSPSFSPSSSPSSPRYDKNGKLTFDAKACAKDYLSGTLIGCLEVLIGCLDAKACAKDYLSGWFRLDLLCILVLRAVCGGGVWCILVLCAVCSVLYPCAVW